MLTDRKIDVDFSKPITGNQALIDELREHNNRIDGQLVELKKKIKLVKNKRKLLTCGDDLIKHNDVSVTRLLAKRFPTKFNNENYYRCIHEIQVALLFLSAFIVITAMSWLVISNTNFLVNSDFSYNVGLLGGFLMLCSIFYALLKRIKFINAMGHNETWFYAHLACGVIGTMLIFFHTTFQINSFNSGVALLCLTIVIVSGIFGRYICTLLSFITQRLYLAISDKELVLINSLLQHHQSTSKPVKSSITRLLATGINKPRHWYQLFTSLVLLPYRMLSLFFSLNRNLKSIFNEIGKRHSWDKEKKSTTRKENRQLALSYSRSIALLSLTSIFSNVFSYWRTIHTSVLYLLTLSAIAHIFAVHMY